MEVGQHISFKTTNGIEAFGKICMNLGHAWQIEIEESKSHPIFNRKNLKLGPMLLIVAKDKIIVETVSK